MSRMAMLSRNGSGPDLALSGTTNLKVEGPASVEVTFWERVANEWAERVVDEIPVGERAVLDSPYAPVVVLAGNADGAVLGWPTMRKFFVRVGEAIEQGGHGRVLGGAVDEAGECWALVVLPLVDDDHAPLLRAAELFVRQGLATHRGRI